MDTIPEEVLNECSVLTKANSIEGCKLPSVKIVFTPVTNLRKEAGFDVGQVSYHSTRQCRYRIAEKNNEIVNRLNKTKQIKTVDDILAEKAARDQAAKEAKKAELKRQQKQMVEEDRRKEERKNQAKSFYEQIVDDPDRMTTNLEIGKKVSAKEFEENFF